MSNILLIIAAIDFFVLIGFILLGVPLDRHTELLASGFALILLSALGRLSETSEKK